MLVDAAALPRNASGKVQKYRLVEMIRRLEVGEKLTLPLRRSRL